jgi:uncharacterized membrane protein
VSTIKPVSTIKHMSTIKQSVDIAAPAERIWALLEDVRRLPEYSESTDAILQAPPRLTAVGQEYVQVGRLLGVKLKSRWRVTAIEPGRLLSSVGSLAPGVRYTLTQWLEPLPDGRTRLWTEIDYTIPGGALGRFAARAGAEARAGREAQAVLDGIRATAEAPVPRAADADDRPGR